MVSILTSLTYYCCECFLFLLTIIVTILILTDDWEEIICVVSLFSQGLYMVSFI